MRGLREGGVPAPQPVSDLPPVLVADIQMPGIDGLQLCRRIRASKYSPDIKVIVYTAGMATPEEAKRAGCDEYFLKTDPLPKLREKIRQYTGARPGGTTS